MLLISASEVPGLLPMETSIPLMAEGFSIISAQSGSVAERQSLQVQKGTGLLMGAASEKHGIAAKLVSVMPDNQNLNLPGSIGLVLLLDAETGTPLVLMDGTSLTAIRTAALNACAIQLLSRPDSKKALIVGCGTQASAQLEALVCIRDLEEIRVLGRNDGRVQAFVAGFQGKFTPRISGFTDVDAAVAGVDIIIAATNSLEPVLAGHLIPDGCHVSGIGSFTPGMCELDNELLLKASIFVENRETASKEAGELIAVHDAGLSRIDEWTEVGEVLSGIRPGRQSDSEITFFKSVGHAVFDLIAARSVYEAAIANSTGMEWQP